MKNLVCKVENGNGKEIIEEWRRLGVFTKNYNGLSYQYYGFINDKFDGFDEYELHNTNTPICTLSELPKVWAELNGQTGSFRGKGSDGIAATPIQPLPVKGQMIWVWDDDKEKAVERIFSSMGDSQERHPVRCVPETQFELFNTGQKYLCVAYKNYSLTDPRKSENLPDFLYEDNGQIKIGSMPDTVVTDEWNKWVEKHGKSPYHGLC